MSFFDFHHHHKNYQNGIYNLDSEENIPENYFSVGIHPHNLDDQFEIKFHKIKTLSLNNNCIAIGECGLDRLVDIDGKIQEEAFIKHILWANEIRKPIVIHCVRKFSELLKCSDIAKVPLIIHGFNRKQAIADGLLQKGFYLSFGKGVLQNVSLQDLIKDFPMERLFLETDDADLNIEELYLKVSELKNISPENLQAQIFENLARITNL